jgi:hypothetical protein
MIKTKKKKNMAYEHISHTLPPIGIFWTSSTGSYAMIIAYTTGQRCSDFSSNTTSM